MLSDASVRHCAPLPPSIPSHPECPPPPSPSRRSGPLAVRKAACAAMRREAVSQLAWALVLFVPRFVRCWLSSRTWRTVAAWMTSSTGVTTSSTWTSMSVPARLPGRVRLPAVRSHTADRRAAPDTPEPSGLHAVQTRVPNFATRLLQSGALARRARWLRPHCRAGVRARRSSSREGLRPCTDPPRWLRPPPHRRRTRDTRHVHRSDGSGRGSSGVCRVDGCDEAASQGGRSVLAQPRAALPIRARGDTSERARVVIDAPLARAPRPCTAPMHHATAPATCTPRPAPRTPQLFARSRRPWIQSLSSSWGRSTTWDRLSGLRLSGLHPPGPGLPGPGLPGAGIRSDLRRR